MCLQVDAENISEYLSLYMAMLVYVPLRCRWSPSIPSVPITYQHMPCCVVSSLFRNLGMIQSAKHIFVKLPIDLEARASQDGGNRLSSVLRGNLALSAER